MERRDGETLVAYVPRSSIGRTELVPVFVPSFLCFIRSALNRIKKTSQQSQEQADWQKLGQLNSSRWTLLDVAYLLCSVSPTRAASRKPKSDTKRQS